MHEWIYGSGKLCSWVAGNRFLHVNLEDRFHENVPDGRNTTQNEIMLRCPLCWETFQLLGELKSSVSGFVSYLFESKREENIDWWLFFEKKKQVIILALFFFSMLDIFSFSPTCKNGSCLLQELLHHLFTDLYLQVDYFVAILTNWK